MTLAVWCVLPTADPSVAVSPNGTSLSIAGRKASYRFSQVVDDPEGMDLATSALLDPIKRDVAAKKKALLMLHAANSTMAQQSLLDVVSYTLPELFSACALCTAATVSVFELVLAGSQSHAVIDALQNKRLRNLGELGSMEVLKVAAEAQWKTVHDRMVLRCSAGNSNANSLFFVEISMRHYGSVLLCDAGTNAQVLLALGHVFRSLRSVQVDATPIPIPRGPLTAVVSPYLPPAGLCHIAVFPAYSEHKTESLRILRHAADIHAVWNEDGDGRPSQPRADYGRVLAADSGGPARGDRDASRDTSRKALPRAQSPGSSFKHVHPTHSPPSGRKPSPPHGSEPRHSSPAAWRQELLEDLTPSSQLITADGAYSHGDSGARGRTPQQGNVARSLLPEVGSQQQVNTGIAGGSGRGVVDDQAGNATPAAATSAGQTLQEENTALRHTISKLRSNHAKYQWQVDAAMQDRGKLLTAVATSAKEESEAEHTIAVLEEEVRRCQETNMTLKETVRMMEGKAADLEGAAVRSNKENIELANIISKLSVRADELGDVNLKLQEERDEMQVRVAELTDELQRRRKEFGEAVKKAKGLESKETARLRDATLSRIQTSTTGGWSTARRPSGKMDGVKSSGGGSAVVGVEDGLAVANMQHALDHERREKEELTRQVAFLRAEVMKVQEEKTELQNLLMHAGSTKKEQRPSPAREANNADKISANESGDGFSAQERLLDALDHRITPSVSSSSTPLPDVCSTIGFAVSFLLAQVAELEWRYMALSGDGAKLQRLKLDQAKVDAYLAALAKLRETLESLARKPPATQMELQRLFEASRVQQMERLKGGSKASGNPSGAGDDVKVLSILATLLDWERDRLTHLRSLLGSFEKLRESQTL